MSGTRLPNIPTATYNTSRSSKMVLPTVKDGSLSRIRTNSNTVTLTKVSV